MQTRQPSQYHWDMNKTLPKTTEPSGVSEESYKIYNELQEHYQSGIEDNDVRMYRENGWNDITDAYWGKLPDDWPYMSRVVDPRIRTSLIEKNGRLLNAKLRGRVAPRDPSKGGDVLKAKIQNALCDYQWDTAKDGGTMLEKWGEMDLETRMYGSKFGLVLWKHEEEDCDGCKECDYGKDDKKKHTRVLFDGNEFYPLDLRNVWCDQGMKHIRNAKWAQVRDWTAVEDLENINDTDSSNPMYPGLDELKAAIHFNKDDTTAVTSDRRDNAFTNRILQLKGLTDRVGEDKSFPIVEIVTEYRADRFITFAPKYKVILRDIPNPYKHHKIPLVQLRYYVVTGDPIGESEVEPVLPIWRAIQATICGYLDTMNIHMRPPLKILEGRARIESIVFEPEAQWLMDQVDAVTEHTGSPQPMQLFQATYSALSAAFNQAMGDLSQQVAQEDPFSGDAKTATEVKFVNRQQNARDQKNQTSLAEALQDMMSMWISNNKQFLFTDMKKKEYLLNILGGELFSYFQRSGLSDYTINPQNMQMLGEMVKQDPNLSDEDLGIYAEAAKEPLYPVVENPEEKDPTKLISKPKMRINEMGDSAELSIVPEDLEGSYDYIADVQSMATGAIQESQQLLEKLFTRMTDPNVIQLLAAEQVRPNIKEMIIDSANAIGINDPEKYFSPIQPQPAADPTAGGASIVPTQGAGVIDPQAISGIQGDPQASLGGVSQGFSAQPTGFPQQGGVL